MEIHSPYLKIDWTVKTYHKARNAILSRAYNRFAHNKILFKRIRILSDFDCISSTCKH